MEPIKNGLKCWLEGTDVTNSSTTWKDRSGNNNNFSIIGSLTTENNMAVFSGSQHAAINNLNIEHGTIEITAAYGNESGNFHGFGSWESNKYKFAFGNYCVTIRKKSNPASSAGFWDARTSQNIEYGDVVTYGLSYNENTYSIFYNGKIIDKGVSSEIPSMTSFYLGLKSDDNTKHAGKVKSLRMYNRKLEHHEILANYQYELLDRNKNMYVNDNNLPKIVEKLSDASNIKITGNKHGDRVQTVIDEIVKKADNVTKAINQEVINNTYLFKAGKGNNVDVSLDVQNGFSELAIKGETYHNIVSESFMAMGDSLRQDSNGDIIFSKSIAAHSANKPYCLDFERLDTLLTQATGQVYTVVFSTKQCNENNELLIGLTNPNASGWASNNVVISTNGMHVAKLTTHSATPWGLRIRKANSDNSIDYSVSKRILLLKGDHTNNPNLPSYFEGIVGVGNENKNLLNPSTFSPSNGVSIKDGVLNINLLTDGGQRTIYSGLNIPKGIYTVTIEVIEGNYAGGNLIFYNSSNTKYSEVRISGRHVVNTGDNDINKLTLWAIKGVCKLRIQIEKGSIATLYEPYHNGYKIEVVTTGKNLCCAKTVNQDWEFGDSMDTWISNNNLNYHSCEAFAIPHLANKKIYAGLIRNGLAHSDNINFAVIYDKNRVRIGSRFGIPNTGYTLPANAYYMRLMHYAGNSSTLQYIYKDDYYLGLEPITKNTAYEPYQEEKTQILLNEPLMKLPNGVCDEITKDGKLVRRIGKIVLNGNEAWFNNGPWSGGDYQACYIRISNKGGNKLDLVCDKFGVTSQKTNSSNQVTNECCFGEVGNGVLYLIISKQKLSTPDMSGLKRWLSDNPTTVYYELSNPIITDLNNQIKIFKDGHLTFNTLVAPESTHIVQLNKSAQIHNAIKQSQLLDNKIAVLENNYDSLMLSTMSTLNDLEFDYTLK